MISIVSLAASRLAAEGYVIVQQMSDIIDCRGFYHSGKRVVELLTQGNLATPRRDVDA